MLRCVVSSSLSSVSFYLFIPGLIHSLQHSLVEWRIYPGVSKSHLSLSEKYISRALYIRVFVTTLCIDSNSKISSIERTEGALLIVHHVCSITLILLCVYVCFCICSMAMENNAKKNKCVCIGTHG